MSPPSFIHPAGASAGFTDEYHQCRIIRCVWVSAAWSPTSCQGEVLSPHNNLGTGLSMERENGYCKKGTKKFVSRCLSRQGAVIVEGDLYILEVAGLQPRNFLKMGEASRLGKKGKSLTARHFSIGFGHSWL